MTNQQKHPFPQAALAGLLLLIYPTLMLTVRGGMNGVFIIALLAALLAWPFARGGQGMHAGSRDFLIYMLAMFGLTVAIFISQTCWQSYSGRAYDAASRYWLALPVFLWLSRMQPGIFRALDYAFPVAAIAGFLLTEEMWGRVGITTLDLIHFGDIELMFGFLSLYSLDWFGRDPKAVRVLKIAGFLAGVAASLASGSRGGWLAIPVFLAIFVYFNRGRLPPRLGLGLLLVTFLSMALLYALNSTIHQRVNELANDVRQYQAGNRDTSIGIRWQLYAAAVDIYLRHPLVGVGPAGFAREMQPMMETGKLTPEAANLGRGEVHNDILAKTAGMGIFGLAAILALYLVPLRLFWGATHSAVREVRRAGILGVTFVSGIFVFGLTVEFLNLTMAAAFYAFTVAVLLAACNSVGAYAAGQSILRDGK